MMGPPKALLNCPRRRKRPHRCWPGSFRTGNGPNKLPPSIPPFPADDQTIETDFGSEYLALEISNSDREFTDLEPTMAAIIPPTSAAQRKLLLARMLGFAATDLSVQ